LDDDYKNENQDIKNCFYCDKIKVYFEKQMKSVLIFIAKGLIFIIE